MQVTFSKREVQKKLFPHFSHAPSHLILLYLTLSSPLVTTRTICFNKQSLPNLYLRAFWIDGFFMILAENNDYFLKQR
jgi:hypothetical protein